VVTYKEEKVDWKKMKRKKETEKQLTQLRGYRPPKVENLPWCRAVEGVLLYRSKKKEGIQ